MKFNGSFWETVGATGFSGGGSIYTDPSLAISNGGEPYVAFRDSGNENKMSVMKFNGNDWIYVGTSGFSAGNVIYPSLAFGPNGEPYVAYTDGGNGGKATLMKFDGSDWIPIGNAGFSDDEATYISLAFSNGGAPCVAFRDKANSNKATAMLFNGTNWVAFGTEGFSEGAVGYTSLAFSNAGIPHVAYLDASNGEKASVMRYTGTLEINTVQAVSFSIYPNPAQHNIHLQWKEGTQPNSISIRDMQGRNVMEIFPVINTINIETLRSGIYFCVFENADGVFYKKFINIYLYLIILKLEGTIPLASPE